MENQKLEEVFLEMIYRYESVIYKVCSIYISEEYPLADLYQETVYNLWRGYPKFRKDSSESTWIYRIALNTCISGLRKKNNELQKASFSSLGNIFDESYNLEGEIKEMYRLIHQLRSLDRAIILLYLEEKSYQEIADITGLSLSNVATRLKRIKLKLKEMSKQQI